MVRARTCKCLTYILKESIKCVPIYVPLIGGGQFGNVYFSQLPPCSIVGDEMF